MFKLTPPDFMQDEERRRQFEAYLSQKYGPGQPVADAPAPPPPPPPQGVAPPQARPFDDRIRALADQIPSTAIRDSDPEYQAAKASDRFGDAMAALGRGGRAATMLMTGAALPEEQRKSAVAEYLAKKKAQGDAVEGGVRSLAAAQAGMREAKADRVVTEEDIQRAIKANVPEAAARAAASDPAAFRELLVKYASPQDPEKVKAVLQQHQEYVKRGAALKRPVLPTDGEPPKDFAKRVEAAEKEQADAGREGDKETKALPTFFVTDRFVRKDARAHRLSPQAEEEVQDAQSATESMSGLIDQLKAEFAKTGPALFTTNEGQAFVNSLRAQFTILKAKQLKLGTWDNGTERLFEQVLPSTAGWQALADKFKSDAPARAFPVVLDSIKGNAERDLERAARARGLAPVSDFDREELAAREYEDRKRIGMPRMSPAVRMAELKRMGLTQEQAISRMTAEGY